MPDGDVCHSEEAQGWGAAFGWPAPAIAVVAANFAADS